MSTPEAPPPAPPPSQPQPRKVPPPCWTHDETLALIESYRDRWLSLSRSYLRTADWDDVADAVSRKCRHLCLSADKSSAQCRHKIEKLRQRYLAERQRCLSFPGKFFSSWVFFKKLDFIDDESPLAAGSDQTTEMKIGAKGKFRVKSKSIVDRSSMDLGLVGSKNGDPHHDFDGGDGFFLKSPGDRPSVLIESKNYGKIDSNASPNFDNYHVQSPVPPGFKAKKFGKSDGKSNSIIDFDDGFDVGGEFFDNQSSIPQRFRSNKTYSNASHYFHMNRQVEDEIYTGAGHLAKHPGNWHSVPPGLRSKNSNNVNSDSNSKLDSSVLNGSSSRSKFAEKGGGGGGVKREMDPVLEIVSSIKLLQEGFIKMEKMKMDMGMEIEKMRMEMELKHNEMILESQRQIVDAFLKVFLEKHKKAKVMVSSES